MRSSSLNSSFQLQTVDLQTIILYGLTGFSKVTIKTHWILYKRKISIERGRERETERDRKRARATERERERQRETERETERQRESDRESDER